MLTYETIADLSQPFVKLMNVGEQIIVNNVHGYLQVKICPDANNIFHMVLIQGVNTSLVWSFI